MNRWAADIYRRLRHVAKAILQGNRTDLQHDFVVDVICLALEKLKAGSNSPWTEYYFLRAVLRHKMLTGMKIVGRFNIEFTSRQVDSLAIALQNGHVLPNQQQWMELAQIIERLDHLSTDTSICIQLHALGYQTAEVAEAVGISSAAVTSRLNYARSLLKKEEYFDDSSTKKATRYVGVYRNGFNNGKPWKAQAFIDGRSIFIGAFDTASQAAVAYDAYLAENGLTRKGNGVLLAQPDDAT